MTLPLAHEGGFVALPVVLPALVVCIVLVAHHLRERRHWDADGED